MEDAPARVPNAQHLRSRAFREVRGSNHTDPGGSTIVHEADPTLADESSPVWGDPIPTLGYDRITLLLDFEKGAATAFNVVAQVASAPGGPWFDLHRDPAGDGVLERAVFSAAVTADGAIAFRVPAEGVFMRFNVFADDADGSTIHTLKAVRLMDAI